MGFSAEQRQFKVMAMILSFSCGKKRNLPYLIHTGDQRNPVDTHNQTFRDGLYNSHHVCKVLNHTRSLRLLGQLNNDLQLSVP